LTIEDGNVYTQTGFDNGKKIEISGGKLTVEQERTDISDIRGIGSGSGWIVINSGTTNLYGTVEKLDISGGKTLAIGSKVFLYGVAKDVSQAGAGTLTVGNDGNEVGQVTGQVRSIEKSEPYPVLYVGTEPIGNSVRTVVADGHFAKMSGHIKTQDTLTIDDANGVQEITGTNKHNLIINDVLSGSSPNLRGSFQNVTLKNSSFVFKDVKIEGTLTLDNSSVAAEGKNPFGKTANERAKVALTKSVLCISNASAFAYVKGIEDAHLHIDELANNTNNSSCIGIEGTFASVTGHVHTCGDVTMESTHDRATYDGGAPIEGTFLRDKAVVVGGTPLAKDLTSGKEWSLTLKDTKGHSNVELDSRKDYDANPAESNFRSIEVVDGVGASDVNNVSLTMAKGARAINVINENPPAPALGLKAVGDEKTVVGLAVNQITGSGIGVDLNNITAAITGAGLTNKIYSSNLEGILLDGANLHLHGFDLEGKTNGITMKNHGAINLHEVKNITGKTKGISVENGTVIGTVSGSGIITATADDGIAFYVKASTASLRDYNFMATGLRSTGVWVDGGATTDPVTQVTLSAITPASKIHGQENGIYVAENANLNIKDYEVKGTDSKNGQVKGGQVKGSLNLSGVNRFEGADYGLQVTGGIVTNKIGAKGAYDGSGLLKCGTDGQNALYVKDETVDLNRYNITGGSAANPPLVIESGEVTLSDSTITGTQQSKVAEKGILNIGSGVTLKDSDTLIVDGLLNVSQPMTTKVMVNKTGTLHIKDGGSIIGDITNVGKIQVDTGGSIIGTIANNGEVVVAGTVKGTVDGQGAVATLRVDNTTGTGIDVKGTFKTLTTTTKNAVTMVGELTIEGTGSKDSFATVNPNRVTPYNLTVKD
ncbi:MAG: polymer-forming cytoskeletal protein, partial [Anaerovorax sp.]